MLVYFTVFVLPVARSNLILLIFVEIEILPTPLEVPETEPFSTYFVPPSEDSKIFVSCFLNKVPLYVQLKVKFPPIGAKASYVRELIVQILPPSL